MYLLFCLKGMVELKLFFNPKNEVDITGLNNKATVQDFFDAVDEFLTENPLPCETCKEHCCKGRFKINMDSVSARRMSKGNVKRLIPKLFIDMGQDKLEIFLIAGHKQCRQLDGLGRCLKYKERPARFAVLTSVYLKANVIKFSMRRLLLNCIMPCGLNILIP